MSKMKIEMKTYTLLGVNEKLMTSRTMTKNYFNEIKNILYEVLKPLHNPQESVITEPAFIILYPKQHVQSLAFAVNYIRIKNNS